MSSLNTYPAMFIHAKEVGDATMYWGLKSAWNCELQYNHSSYIMVVRLFHQEHESWKNL